MNLFNYLDNVACGKNLKDTIKASDYETTITVYGSTNFDFQWSTSRKEKNGIFKSQFESVSIMYIIISKIIFFIFQMRGYFPKGPMLTPYHSNRLLPLVVADSASFFYDTKLNKKNSFINNGVQFHCNRVSVPFLQDKWEAEIGYKNFILYYKIDSCVVVSCHVDWSMKVKYWTVEKQKKGQLLEDPITDQLERHICLFSVWFGWFVDQPRGFRGAGEVRDTYQG
jgi:hypothetical protein